MGVEGKARVVEPDGVERAVVVHAYLLRRDRAALEVRRIGTIRVRTLRAVTDVESGGKFYHGVCRRQNACRTLNVLVVVVTPEIEAVAVLHAKRRIGERPEERRRRRGRAGRQIAAGKGVHGAAELHQAVLHADAERPVCRGLHDPVVVVLFKNKIRAPEDEVCLQIGHRVEAKPTSRQIGILERQRTRQIA